MSSLRVNSISNLNRVIKSNNPYNNNNTPKNYRRKFGKGKEDIKDLKKMVKKDNQQYLLSLKNIDLDLSYTIEKEIINRGESFITLLFMNENGYHHLNIIDVQKDEKSLEFDFNNTIGNVPYLPKVNNFEKIYDTPKDYSLMSNLRIITESQADSSFDKMYYLGSLQLFKTNEGYEVDKIFVRIENIYQEKNVNVLKVTKENMMDYLKALKSLNIHEDSVISEKYLNELKSIFTEILKEKALSPVTLTRPIKQENFYLSSYTKLDKEEDIYSYLIKHKRILN